MMEGTGMEKQKYAAIVLAAGSGKRMNSQVHKQYLIIQDRPVLYYSPLRIIYPPSYPNLSSPDSLSPVAPVPSGTPRRRLPRG